MGLFLASFESLRSRTSISFNSGGGVIAPIRAARARFIHDIDGFVREKSIGDITIGKFYRRFHGFVRDNPLYDVPRISGADP